MVIVSLHPDSFKDLSSFIAWLPADQPDGKAGAAAALLANLAQVSGAALQVMIVIKCRCIHADIIDENMILIPQSILPVRCPVADGIRHKMCSLSWFTASYPCLIAKC